MSDPREYAIERFEVRQEPKPLLYRADGMPLKREIGFGMAQTSKTFIELTQPGRKPKKGKCK
jgi:hypothetical protein